MRFRHFSKISISDHFTFKRLLRFVFPSVLMMIVTSIYGVVDGYFVSNFVGKTPFAALNLIYPVVMVLGGAGFMLGTGGTALVSKVEGEGDQEKANRYFTMVIIFAVILGLICMTIGLALMEPLARLLGASDEMMSDCVTYGRICVGFTVFFMLQNIFQSFLAAAGKPQLGLMVTLIAGITNMILDALFMVVFKWGIAGAAVATGIGQVLGGLIPLIYFARKNSSPLRLKLTKLEAKPLLQACGNGSSEFFTNVSGSLISMLYNAQLMAYAGEDGVSAYGVLMYVQLIFLAIQIGFSIGVAPIIAYNYGAQRKDELKGLFKKSLIVMGVSGIVLCGAAEALAYPLSLLFVGYDEALCSLTVSAFRIFSFCFLFSGIGIFSSGFFTALNNGVVSAVLSLLRSLAFQLSAILILPAIFGLTGIWWSAPVAELLAFISAVTAFLIFRKRYGYA